MIETRLKVFLFAAVLCSLTWLDSFDRYLGTRYHLDIESYVPSVLMTISRNLTPQAAAPTAMATASETKVLIPSVTPKTKRPSLYTPSDLAGNSEFKAGEFYPSVAQQTFDLLQDQRLLFVGDSMMAGVAPLAIQSLKKTHPTWEFFDLSKQSTGLLVKRYLDWAKVIAEEIKTKQITVLVLFMGPNDPWDIYEKATEDKPATHIKFPSKAWESRYALEVDTVLQIAALHKVKVVWLGLPTMRTERLHTGAVMQNRVFHARTKAWGVDYLATEGLIGPLSAPYSKHKTDANGKVINLRAEDGTHFAPAGLFALRDALVSHIEGNAK